MLGIASCTSNTYKQHIWWEKRKVHLRERERSEGVVWREMGNVGEIEEIERWVSPSSSSTTTTTGTLPLLSLNHVSFVCKSVAESVKFYGDVLGFVLIKRPSSFDFEGAWLFNYGLGIHLLESDNVPTKKGVINPKDNHISFQCSDMHLVTQKLKEKNIDYVTATVKEGGITVDQLFFHDPDGYMVEICNCQNLPVLPLSSCPLKLPQNNRNQKSPSHNYGKQSWEMMCSGEVVSLMMENLVVDMMDIFI